jgi:predicted nucleic acid-binding protein
VQIYLDSSALVKRAIREPESDALIEQIDEWIGEGSHLVSSTLAWIELMRTIRSRREFEPPRELIRLMDNAVAGIDESPMSGTVADIARRIGPATLRSLDSIHLATATLVGADLVCAYDRRMLASAEELGFRTLAPGA